MEPRVRVVILNYNGGHHVMEAVESVVQLDWPADRLQIVVVDNASSDGSADAIATAFPQVRVVRNPRNTGFSANNLALDELASVDRVALVNPDAAVEPGWLRALDGVLATSPDVGAASPKMLLWDRMVALDVSCTQELNVLGMADGSPDWTERCRRMWHLLGCDVTDDGALRIPAGGSTLPIPVPPTWTCGELPLRMSATGPNGAEAVIDGQRFAVTPQRATVRARPTRPAVDVLNNAGLEPRWLGYVADRGLGAHDGPPFDQTTEVFGWTGGGVLLRTEYLADVGLFDERFFLYYEDVDLSWRGRARGWRFLYVPTAVMRHHHASSSGAGSRLFIEQNERNRLLAVTKNAPLAFVVRCYLRFALSTLGYLRADVVRPILRGERPDPRMVLLRVSVLSSMLIRVRSTVSARRDVQRRRTVPHERIMHWFPEADASA